MVRKMYLMTLEGQCQNMTTGQVRPGQGQGMTRVGKYAYLPKWNDETNRLQPFARPYLQSVANNWKKRIVTSFDPR